LLILKIASRSIPCRVIGYLLLEGDITTKYSFHVFGSTRTDPILIDLLTNNQ
jgi:hypothetical protein